jgi:hypothetical protein
VSDSFALEGNNLIARGAGMRVAARKGCVVAAFVGELPSIGISKPTKRRLGHCQNYRNKAKSHVRPITTLIGHRIAGLR